MIVLTAFIYLLLYINCPNYVLSVTDYTHLTQPTYAFHMENVISQKQNLQNPKIQGTYLGKHEIHRDLTTTFRTL